MPIEWKHRSTIKRETQAAEPANDQPLALKARGAGKALQASRRRTAGSARQLATRVLWRSMLAISLASAIFLAVAAVTARFDLHGSIMMRTGVQMRININIGEVPKQHLSHTQFAVSRVACKAIHWHPTDGDRDRYSHMPIEWKHRSTIKRETQAAEIF